MAGNPLVPQGVLNRLIASITWNSYTALNVTASFLGREGISLAFDGEAVTFIPTLTGNVVSEEPFQMVTVSINLLKPQGLAQQYELQRQTDSLLGIGTVRPDTTALGPYTIINCAIQNVRELRFSGEDASYMITCRGYYPINNSLWS